MASSPPLTAADSVTAFMRTLFPKAVALQLNQVVRDPAHLIVTLTATASLAAWPTCAQPSQRIQSRYMRTLTDLPWGEHSVKLQLHVRRFTCTNPACAQKIFAERLPELVRPYARRTTRLHRQQTTIAFALGGEAGARLCHSQGLPI